MEDLAPYVAELVQTVYLTILIVAGAVRLSARLAVMEARVELLWRLLERDLVERRRGGSNPPDPG